ncbi:MAG: hypothetical protein HFJ12_04385 [Bacilli bacterium]|nr:hypothetical protein [Bacilli bacterium]
MNEDVKKVLEQLGVLDTILETFSQRKIPITSETLSQAGFGFEMLSNSFESMIIITEDIKKFLSYIKDKQKSESLEQAFALFGQLSISDDNQPVIFLNQYVEDLKCEKKLNTNITSRELFQQVNKFLNNNHIRNKVLLLGHTHPLRKDIEIEMTNEKKYIMDSINDLENNPLKVRENGLNLSLGDVASLIHYQKQATRNNFLLEGIVLPNGEFNILYYDGNTIQLLNHVYVMKDDKLESIKSFRHKKEFIRSSNGSK